MIKLLKYLIVGVLLMINMVLALPQLKTVVPYAPNSEGLARLVMNAHLSGTNPERATKCFTDYMQKLNRIGSKYSADYRLCLEKSRNARYTVDMEVSVERRGIVSEAEGICKQLKRCNSMKNSLELFHCHAEVGSNNTQSSYIISANASDFASMLHESYRTISLREERCCSTAERVYVENTTGNYRFLQSCLEGLESPEKPAIASTTESISTEATPSSSISSEPPTTPSTAAEPSIPAAFLTSDIPSESKADFGMDLL